MDLEEVSVVSGRTRGGFGRDICCFWNSEDGFFGKKEVAFGELYAIF